MDFAECVIAAEKRIVKVLSTSSAVVLVPPGLLRDGVVKALVGRADILISRELWRKFEVGKHFALFAGYPYIYTDGSWIFLGDYLKSSGTRGVLIIPEGTVEALLLLRALREGATRPISVVFLPALCQGGPGAEVDFTAVLEGGRGMAPELAIVHEREVDYVREAVDAIRSLSPETLAPTLFRIAAETVEGVAEQTSIPKHAIAGALLAVIIARESGLHVPTPAIALALPGLTERGAETLLENYAEVVEAELPRVVDKLAKAAKKAVVYFNDARFEVIIDEVAAKWGYTISGFREFVNQLSKLAVSQEELRRIFSPYAAYLSTRQFPYIRRDDGKLRVVSPFGDAEYVEHPAEGLILRALRDAARRYGGLVVLQGPRGVGKSTVARVALYKALGSLFLVERGNRAEVFRSVVVEVELHSADELSFRHIVAVANRLGLIPIFFLDPGPVHPWLMRKFVEAVGNIPGAVAFIVLDQGQYKAVKDYIKRAYIIDIEEALGQKKTTFVKTLVEKYSGCPSEVAEKATDAISPFIDSYAVVAVLAADRLRKGGCRGEEVVRAVKETEGNVIRFVLHYLWYGLFNGDEDVAERYAPLLLAVGFFGPHPPKLAKAVIRAFGKEPEDAVIQWFSQPLHGTLYETIKKVAHGAIYRRFGVGSDELCQKSEEGPCRLVEICSKALADIPLREYSGVEEVAVEYAKLIAKALKAPKPTVIRLIDALIQDFLQAYNGVAEDGRWRIRYETKSGRAVDDVVDELDVLSALYGLAALLGWIPQLKQLPKQLEDWFFVGDRRVETVKLYLYPLLKEKGRELVKRAKTIALKAERRGFYTDVDLLHAVGIAAAGLWDSATDEELEMAVKLAVATLHRFATFSPIVLDHIEPLLSEAWRRVVRGGTYGGGGRRQRLADMLTVTAYNAAIGHSHSLLSFFTAGADKLDLEVAAKRFDALYNAASNAGKLLLLDVLLYALDWDIGGVNLAAVLLGKPQVGLRGAFEEVARRIGGFISYLDGVERTYVVARLYPWLARRYTSLSEFDKAVNFAEEALRALDKLWMAYEEDRALMEEKLQPYLALKQIKTGLGEELNELSQYVYHHVAHVYMYAELDKAVEYAKKACESAKKLSDIYYDVAICGLLPRLKAVREGVPPVEEFEEMWQRASQAVEWIGAEIVATALGNYVVALASASRLGDVEKVLEEWGWALELYPVASALTYCVLSLFDGRYLEKAVGHLTEGARANLPMLADALHDAVEAGLFAKDPEIAMLAMKTLTLAYGRDVVEALFEVASDSVKLFLYALVGLAYCKRNEEWGFKLAREVSRIGSRPFKGLGGRLFGELAKALESAAVDNCTTDEVLKAVYKLYYFHV